MHKCSRVVRKRPSNTFHNISHLQPCMPRIQQRERVAASGGCRGFVHDLSCKCRVANGGGNMLSCPLSLNYASFPSHVSCHSSTQAESDKDTSRTPPGALQRCDKWRRCISTCRSARTERAIAKIGRS